VQREESIGKTREFQHAGENSREYTHGVNNMISDTTLRIGVGIYHNSTG
jgi:hypothetical protein